MEENNNDIELQSLKFDTRDELLYVVRDFYVKKGYVLVTESSKGKFVNLKCDRGGYYRDTRGISPDERQRDTATRRIGCPFKIKGRKKDDGSWIVELINITHNHEASADKSGHPSYRRLSHDDMKTVEHLPNSGIAPRQILSSLRQDNPDLPATSRTIYNARAKLRNDNLADRTMIQALIDELGQNGFKYDFEKDGEGRLKRVFFSHPRSVMLTQNFSSVLLFALKEIYTQYEKAKKGTLSPTCTGKFMATMGLPCAHRMKNWKNLVIALNEVNSHWRIDIRQLIISNTQNHDDDDEIAKLLHNFQKKYHEWPLHKKEQFKEKIGEFDNENNMIFEPLVRSHKGAKKRKASNSTRRDPSQFEIVEEALERTSRRANQSDAEMLVGMEPPSSDIPTFIDLNNSPDFSFF